MASPIFVNILLPSKLLFAQLILALFFIFTQMPLGFAFAGEEKTSLEAEAKLASDASAKEADEYEKEREKIARVFEQTTNDLIAERNVRSRALGYFVRAEFIKQWGERDTWKFLDCTKHTDCKAESERLARVAAEKFTKPLAQLAMASSDSIVYNAALRACWLDSGPECNQISTKRLVELNKDNAYAWVQRADAAAITNNAKLRDQSILNSLKMRRFDMLELPLQTAFQRAATYEKNLKRQIVILNDLSEMKPHESHLWTATSYFCDDKEMHIAEREEVYRYLSGLDDKERLRLRRQFSFASCILDRIQSQPKDIQSIAALQTELLQHKIRLSNEALFDQMDAKKYKKYLIEKLTTHEETAFRKAKSAK
jgi:hypothetical protein